MHVAENNARAKGPPNSTLASAFANVSYAATTLFET
jgi:hypothetical protein